MSILKWQVSFSSNFALFFIVMTYNSPVNFKVIPFLLWTKESHQSSNFDIFKCSGEYLPNFSIFFKPQVSFSSKFAYLFSFMKDNSSVLFLAQTTYTLLKRRLLKWRFLRLSNAQVKICQISYVNLETASRFLSKFCIPLQFYER